jgi:tetratricopeptide (TPR) repeat protein
MSNRLTHMKTNNRLRQSTLHLLIALCISAQFLYSSENSAEIIAAAQQASTLTGQPLYSATPSKSALEKLNASRLAYQASPADPDLLVWLGRRTAYTGDFIGAIEIFTKGIELFPNDPRFYRHRGHRYISIREFEQASQSLEIASKLISGTKNEIEPDGLPNPLGIPISSLHGNIWYHLGLAYYSQQDWTNALRAYTNGFNAAGNDDNKVSTTHWRYMILRRMGLHAEAEKVLDAISPEMNVIENTNYYNLCLFYKGIISLDELTGGLTDNPGGAAISYGVANWHFVEGNLEQAEKQLNALTSSNSWASFGFIAAESDLFHQKD